jgi:hypothetical protein
MEIIWKVEYSKKYKKIIWHGICFRNCQNKRNTDTPRDMSSGEENCTIGFIVEFIATAIMISFFIYFWNTQADDGYLVQPICVIF